MEENMMELLTTIGLFLSAGGLILTGGGLIFAAKQVRAANEQARAANEQARAASEQLETSQRIARGEFLLHLDEIFRHHDRVHRRLLPNRGEWGSPENGPPLDDSEAWADIESYMGLFERIKVLIDAGMIDKDTMNRLYGYRISNIVRNNVIRVGKLENPETKGGWTDFIELATLLGRYRIHERA
jgi:hypothetical protein